MSRFKSIFKRFWSWKTYLVLVLLSALVQSLPSAAPSPAADERMIEVAAQLDHGASPSAAPVRLVYSDTGGDHDVVILLHGSPGSAGNFDRLIPLLASRYRVIALDLPGFGDSSHWVPDYGIAAHARYVLALMDELHIQRAHVMGFSMGSGVALHMAELAPQRIDSLTFYGGIGIQEGEGSGSYGFEHFKYALGYGLLVVAPEALPHFGLLGPRSRRHAFMRNFWDTDQRPLRSMIERLDKPLLILHGRDDPLVPLWVAFEHHRLSPRSRLVVYDASHFMLFGEAGAQRIADAVLPFLAHPLHEADGLVRYIGFVPPGKPWLESLPPKHVAGPWTTMGLLAAGTLVSEDLTCITTGMLLRAGRIDWFVGIFGCFCGIYFGDLCLWSMGRIFGRRLLRWRWLARRLPEARLQRMGHWFDRHAGKAIIASRFMPGTRLAFYISSGMLGRKPWRFVFWSFIAALSWTPIVVLLVAWLGESFVRPFEKFLGGGWIGLLAAIVVGYLLVRVVEQSLTAIGRARLRAKVSRLWRWEFWPMGLFYVPVLPWIALLAVRYRSLAVISAANPAIPLGGFVGESKLDILARLPAEHVLFACRIEGGEPAVRFDALRQHMLEQGLDYPIVLKPDVGERGAGVRLVQSPADAQAYFAAHAEPVLAQQFHPGPYEAGIFYYRIPGETRGRIFAVTDKHFPLLSGDGRHTIEELIWRHPRYRMQAGTFLARLGDQAERVPAAGQTLRLAMAGNHCQGTLFRDGMHLVTPELEAAIDAIARHDPDFHFGRFDVRYSDPARFQQGLDLAIIELNGITSEATSLYDPNHSLLSAYRTLYRQWALLFRIGALNRRRGHQPAKLRDLWRALRQHRRNPPVTTLAD
ncbi:MAG: alpha/beta fold hydrolase [Phycisphaeraceae bacterium]